MTDKKPEKNYFPPKEFSYCFNVSEPVRVAVHTYERQAFRLEDSCYRKRERKYKKDSTQ